MNCWTSPCVTDVFDFARFSYDNVVAEDGHVIAVFHIGVTGTDEIIKIAQMKNPSWLLQLERSAQLSQLEG